MSTTTDVSHDTAADVSIEDQDYLETPDGRRYKVLYRYEGHVENPHVVIFNMDDDQEAHTLYPSVRTVKLWVAEGDWQHIPKGSDEHEHI
jgi:hypothetical protein